MKLQCTANLMRIDTRRLARTWSHGWCRGLRALLDSSPTSASPRRSRPRHAAAPSRFRLAGGQAFQDAARHLLQLPEARQIILEFTVEFLRLHGRVARAQDHVAQLDGMRQNRVFLQFFESDFRVVVIHVAPCGSDLSGYCTRGICA